MNERIANQPKSRRRGERNRPSRETGNTNEGKASAPHGRHEEDTNPIPKDEKGVGTQQQARQEDNLENNLDHPTRNGIRRDAGRSVDFLIQKTSQHERWKRLVGRMTKCLDIIILERSIQVIW